MTMMSDTNASVVALRACLYNPLREVFRYVPLNLFVVEAEHQLLCALLSIKSIRAQGVSHIVRAELRRAVL